MTPATRCASALLAAALVAPLTLTPSQAAPAPPHRDIGYHQWTSPVDFLSGQHQGTSMAGGNLVFRRTARNFNPAVAMAGKVCIVEVEKIVEVGELAPDDIHLPGIYVHRIVHNPNPEKRIEKRTTRPA